MLVPFVGMTLKLVKSIQNELLVSCIYPSWTKTNAKFVALMMVVKAWMASFVLCDSIS